MWLSDPLHSNGFLRLASPVFSTVIIISMHVIYNLLLGYRFELLVSIN
jgi:hypothetical protein